MQWCICGSKNGNFFLTAGGHMSGSCRDMGDCESRFLYENFATLYWWGYESCQCGNLQHHYWSSYDSTRIAGVLRSSEREQMPTYNGKPQSYRVPYEYNVFTFKFFVYSLSFSLYNQFFSIILIICIAEAAAAVVALVYSSYVSLALNHWPLCQASPSPHSLFVSLFILAACKFPSYSGHH